MKKHVGILSVLVLSSAFFLVLISAPPLRLKDPLRDYSRAGSDTKKAATECAASHLPSVPPSLADELQKTYATDANLLLSEELKKTNDEIKLRLEQGDRWYDYKFLILGAFLAAFLSQFVFRKRTTEKKLEELLTSNVTSVALALAAILALAIDIHLRADLNVVNQIGSWIAYYAEPRLLHQCFQGISQSAPMPPAFLPWENFLRVAGGEHNSTLLSLVLWPHLHLLTWIIYIVYLIVFQNSLRRQNDQLNLSYDPRLLAWGGFVLVHITVFLLAVESHSIPNTFEFVPFGITVSADSAPLIYSIPVLPLIGVNIAYALWPGKREEPVRRGPPLPVRLA